jgi:hypothetical protein
VPFVLVAGGSFGSGVHGLEHPARLSKTVTTSGAAAWTPGIIIAGCALLFTVATFWWLNARRARLKSFAPHTFSTLVTREEIRLLLPLVFYNPGAVPIIIQNLRFKFIDEPCSKGLAWVTTRREVRPQKDDWTFPAVFSVAGRTAYQTFVEFKASSLGFKLKAADYRVALDARLGHKKDWWTVLTFTLHAGRVSDPENFITYENAPDNLSEDDRKEVQLALDFALMGSKPGKSSEDGGMLASSE